MFDFDDIIKSAKIYLAAKDKNLKYLYCNDNVAAGLGLESPKQIIGKSDYDLFEDDIANIYRSGDQLTLKGGILVNSREIQPHTDKTIQILTTKNKLKNKAGKLLGVVISFIDITGLSINIPNDVLKYDTNKKVYTFLIGKQKECFTRREYDIFRYLLMGYTNNLIADKLSLSPRTVEMHINNIKTKLQCSSRHQIPETAVRLGILQQNIIDNLFPR